MVSQVQSKELFTFSFLRSLRELPCTIFPERLPGCVCAESVAGGNAGRDAEPLLHDAVELPDAGEQDAAGEGGGRGETGSAR